MSIFEKIKITIRGYGIINSLTPRLLPAMFAQGLAAALLPLINIVMSAQIITALVRGAGIRDLFVLVALTVILNVVTGLVSGIASRINNYHAAKFFVLFKEPINEKIRAMDYEKVEDANTHLTIQKIELLRANTGMGIQRLYFSFTDLIKSSFQIIFTVSLVAGAFTAQGDGAFVFSPWMSLIVMILIGLNVIFSMRNTSNQTNKIMSEVGGFEQMLRSSSYYYDYIVNYKAGKDLKLNSLQASLSEEYGNAMEKIVGLAKKINAIEAKYSMLNSASSTVLSGIIYAFVAIKALFGGFAVGNVVQYVGALAQFSLGISTFMNTVTFLSANTEALAILYSFLDEPNKMHSGFLGVPKESKHIIEFKNVSFKYPNADNYALENLNLKITPNRSLGIVGMNGSGKTTMIKLLCRLYDPTEGCITLNGKDLREYDYDEYLKLFSAVFQDFKLFSFSLKQNVGIDENADEAKVTDCLNKAGFDKRLNSLQQGIETPLYKDFEAEGIELSGGEAQKIAIARALYKDSPFFVLDEPTAALDPISEYEIYNKFDEINSDSDADKTIIFISHRLSSCRFCDTITVFHEGRLIQQGRHDELLSDVTGKYYEMWNAQAQYYK